MVLVWQIAEDSFTNFTKLSPHQTFPLDSISSSYTYVITMQLSFVI